MRLFTPGNDKVGRALVWNLPVFKSCPGSTPFCRTFCYGDWGSNRWPTTRQRHQANYRVSLKEDFPARALAELQARWRRQPRLVRVHSVGDFYSAEYVRKWVEIATTAPEWTFWAYTRSWRVPDLLPELERLALLPNFDLWASVDFQTGLPPEEFPARGVAVMQAPGESLDWIETTAREVLVFPVKAEEREPVKRIGLAMVCPHYNGTPKDKVPTCEGCRFCFPAGGSPAPGPWRLTAPVPLPSADPVRSATR
jgi:hypothetical protein